MPYCSKTSDEADSADLNSRSFVDPYTIKTSHRLIRHAFPVDFYWQIDMSPIAPGTNLRVLPSLHIDVIFPLAKSIELAEEGKSLHLPFVSPIRKTSISLNFTPGMRLFGIRFHPVYANSLISVPLKELEAGYNDLKISCYNAIFNSLTILVESCDDFETRIYIVNEYLGRVSGQNGHVHKKVCQSAITYLRENPHAKVKDLSKMTGYSSRWIERLFSENLGTSPQDIIRITRFNRFLTLLQNKSVTSLTSLAYESGYYDQSHMIKDFRRFSSDRPSEFIQHIPLLNKVMNGL